METLGGAQFSFWWAFPAFFVVTWVSIFHVIARWGGWKLLAEAYPPRVAPAGERFRWRSARLRAGCNYNNCITFVSGRAGLHMSLPLPFAFGHQPIQIPWDDLRVEEETWWLIPIAVLTAARCPEVPIRLHRPVAQRLLEGAGAHPTGPVGT